MSIEPSQYKILQPFEAWVQQTLPAIYDDSLSYTDLLAKLLYYVNTLAENNTTLSNDVKNAINYINDYLGSNEFTDQVRNKLDEMASDGTLSRLIKPLFDEYKKTINQAIATQNTNISNIQSEQNTLKQRMDTFTSLPSGSTSGDAELQDIRVGANGVTYNTAGDAVREQYNQLNKTLDKTKNDIKEEIDNIENNGFNVRKSRNIMNPSGITKNSWLLTNGTIQTPSPYGDGTTVYNGAIEGGHKLFMTYQNASQRDIFEVSRYVFENSTGVISSSNNTLMNGINIPIGATNIKILFNTKSLNTKLQMEYDSVSDYLEYGSKFLTHKKTDINVDSTFFSPRYLYVYSGTMRYIDKMNVVASISDNLMHIESTQNDPSIGIKDKICAIYGVDKIELKSKITGDILFSKPIGLNKVNVSTKTNPSNVVNIMMIGDSYTANNILPCDIKKQLVNDHKFTNYNFVGGITGTDNGITCKHEGRAGYSIGDYLKVNNENAGGNKFPNPYLYNGKVSIKEYCDNKNIQYPDVFIVELGINDIEKGYISDGVYGPLNERIKQFIHLIHSEFTDSKILIVGVIYASVDNGQGSYVYKNKERMLYNSSLETLSLSDDYKSFTKYCDVGALFDTVNGYGWNEKIAYRGSEEKIKTIADWLHPCRAGYYMESDCIVPTLLDFNIE